MKWNFGKTGISLSMTWAAWKFRKIAMGPLMLTPPDDTQGVLVVQVARSSRKTIPGGKFRRRRGIGMARWRFSQGGLYRSRLIALRRKGWIVLFEAVSETSPTWPSLTGGSGNVSVLLGVIRHDRGRRLHNEPRRPVSGV